MTKRLRVLYLFQGDPSAIEMANWPASAQQIRFLIVYAQFSICASLFVYLSIDLFIYIVINQYSSSLLKIPLILVQFTTVVFWVTQNLRKNVGRILNTDVKSKLIIDMFKRCIFILCILGNLVISEYGLVFFSRNFRISSFKCYFFAHVVCNLSNASLYLRIN